MCSNFRPQNIHERADTPAADELNPLPMTHVQHMGGTDGWRGLFRYARAAFRLVTNGGYRSRLLLRWLRPNNLFQVNNYTVPDRYPVLFRRTREKLGDGPNLRLLS